MKKRLRETGQRLRVLASSTRGRNVCTFLVFLVVAAIFWNVVALNDEMQQEFEVPLELVGVPADIVLISLPPSTVSVSVRDKGTSLLRYSFGELPVLKIQYKDFVNNGRKLSIGETQCVGAVRSFFGQGASVSGVKPDSLSLPYTKHQGVVKHIKVVSDVTTAPQYIVSGPLVPATDTVRVYSQRAIPRSITHIETEPVTLSALTDTTEVEVRLVAPDGMRVIPPTVKVTVPVEALIAKKREIPIEVRKVPAGHRVITFPSTVEISYLVPMSVYNNDNHVVKAYADYRKSANKLALSLSAVPDDYTGAVLLTDSVEYLLEHK